MELFFYDGNPKYIDYLKKKETESRGFTRVPDIEYKNEKKMVCGIVLEINEHKYYVPISSYKKKQANNILITLKDDAYNQVKGSLRFNYMFPINDECVTRRDFSRSKNAGRKEFLRRQWVFCNSIAEDIKKMALDTYNSVNAGKDSRLINASCDFKLLEAAADKYEKNHKVTYPK